MQARDIMSNDPRSCAGGDSLQTLAALMREARVGENPAIDGQRKLLGVITDHDIVVRCVAAGASPAVCRVQDYMAAAAQYLAEDAPVAALGCPMADLEQPSARLLKERVAQHASHSP